MARLKATLPSEYLAAPYDATDDALSKRDLAERVTHLYASLEHNSVAILHGRWGVGKSVFAKKLVHHMEAAGLSVTYFDAFANDYVNDPFVALSAHIFREIDLRGNGRKRAATAFKKAAAKVSKKLLVTTAKIATKAVTLGVIGASEIDDLSGIAEDIASASGELSEAAMMRMIEQFSQSETEFQEFRKALSKLPEALAKDESPEGVSTSAIFIIDELDRCRPDFALGLLEVLKHFFGEDGVHFLLVTNKDYLIKSVDARYGLGAASEEYLEKFFDFLIFFEESEGSRHRHAATVLVGRLVDDLCQGANRGELEDLKEYLQEFAAAFDLTLRQASALATNASLAYLATRQGEFRPPALIAVLALFRARFPEVYRKIKTREYTRQDLSGAFGSGKFSENFSHERVSNILEFYAAFDGEINREDDKYRGFNQVTARYHFDNYRNILPLLANSVFDRFGRT